MFTVITSDEKKRESELNSTHEAKPVHANQVVLFLNCSSFHFMERMMITVSVFLVISIPTSVSNIKKKSFRCLIVYLHDEQGFKN